MRRFDPAELHRLLVPIWQRTMAAWRAAGLNPRATRGYCSWAEQDALYAQGRTTPGAIVTQARGGQSWHNVERDGFPAALAFDACMLSLDGKSILSKHDTAWLTAGEIAESLGLTWGGRFGDDPSTTQIEGWDMWHYQLDDRGGLALHEAIRGVDPEGMGT